MKRAYPTNAGFTLLEMIVVIGIFALMASMAYGGLSTVLNNRARLDAALDRIGTLQKAYWIMRDDFQNGIDRAILNENDQLRFALQYTGIDHRVAFTRAGWPNPLNLPRSTLRRLGYFYDADKQELIRRTWPVLDRAPQTQPVDTVLLKNVKAVQWRFLDAQGNWQDHWPTRGQQMAAANNNVTGNSGIAHLAASVPPPRAVELVLRTKDWGRLRWLFSYGFPHLQGQSHLYQLPAQAQTTSGSSGNAQGRNNSAAGTPSGRATQ